MKIKHILFICAALPLLGCSDFLDITPKDKQTADQLFSTKGGFYIASNGVYNGLASNDLYGRVMSYEAIDILAKRYTVPAANLYFTALDAYGYTDANVEPVISNVWEEAYRLIMACNLLMEKIHSQEAILTQTECDIMEGEMLAVRAFLHLDMLRLFGPRWNNNPDAPAIPYNESSEVLTLPLLPFGEVIENIIRDIDEAERLLANDPVIEQGPMASESANESVQLRYRQFRFNYYSVKVLKARAYLYAGDKTNALAAAKSLLDDAAAQRHFPAVDPNQLLANYTNPDRVFSSEVLMGVYVKARDEAFTRYFSSETAGANFLQPYATYVNSRLFALMFTGAGETTDYRYQSQWEVASGVGVTGHIFTKYKAITQPDPTADNEEPEYFYSRMIPLLRFSEAYYIAAECEPVPADAFKWLNEIRRRRGLEALPSGTHAANLTSLLTGEYLREFYGEGQAFFFYKRMGIDQVYDNGSVLNYAFYSDGAYRPPLPVGEMKSN